MTDRRAPSHSEEWHPHFGAVSGARLADWLVAQSPAPKPTKTIVVASEERSGSEWLCQMMQATDRLGRPSEYLNAVWVRRFIPDYPEDVESQIAVARRVGTTPNGCLSIKLHPWHFDKLESQVRFADCFPSAMFVRLTRSDLLGQALSLVRARQTQSYHQHIPQQALAKYDASATQTALFEIANNRARWDVFFARNGVQPLSLTYEELSRWPRRSLRRIANFAGEILPFNLPPIGRRLAVQRDQTTDLWRRRFLFERHDLNGLDRIE